MPRLGSFNTAMLTAELSRRERLLPGLKRRHERIVAEARSLAAEIAAMGGTANGAVRASRGRPGRRARGNKQTLVQALTTLLHGRTMRVIEAANAVRKAGYRTTGKNFRVQVGIALGKGPFRRVGRGRYTAAGGPAPKVAAATPNGVVPARRSGRRRRTGPGSRAPRVGSVVSVLQGLLKGKTMTVTDVVAAVRKSGYKTKAKAKSFYHAVAVSLAKSGRFRRVGRGKYRAK